MPDQRTLLGMREQENNGETPDERATSHMPLVSHIVRETMERVPSHVNRDDLTSAGLHALVLASRSYQDERGVPFARYAAIRIRGAILDELRKVDWASRSVRRRARDLDATRNELAATLGRSPSQQEVASAAGLTMDEFARHEGDVSRAQVLSLQGAQDAALDELLPSGGPTPEQLVEHRERLSYLVAAVAELPERLRAVVAGYFFDERPMAEIAAELGVTESRISQMRAEALKLLRGAMDHSLDPEHVVPPENPRSAATRRRESYYASVAVRHAAATGLRVAALDTSA